MQRMNQEIPGEDLFSLTIINDPGLVHRLMGEFQFMQLEYNFNLY